MKTSVFIALLALSFFALFPLTAEKKAKIPDKSEKKDSPASKNGGIILFKDTVINRNDILQKCEEMKIGAADAKTDSSALSGSAMWFGEYSNHPKIEEETNIRREWYKKMSTMIGKMQEFKYKIECLQEEPDILGNPELAKKGEIKYVEMLKAFKKLADHPEKIKTGKK